MFQECRFRYLAKELRHRGPGVGNDDLEDGARRAGHGQEPAERLRRMGVPSSWNLADLTGELREVLVRIPEMRRRRGR